MSILHLHDVAWERISDAICPSLGTMSSSSSTLGAKKCRKGVRNLADLVCKAQHRTTKDGATAPNWLQSQGPFQHRSQPRQCRHLATLYCMTIVSCENLSALTRTILRTDEISMQFCLRRPIDAKLDRRKHLRRSVTILGHS